MISILTGHVNRSCVLKRKAEGEKTIRNSKGARLDVLPKSCQLIDIILLKYFAFVVEGCDYHAEPDIVILFKKIALKYSGGGTRLAMPKTSCVPNISSLKTGSGAIEGVLD